MLQTGIMTKGLTGRVEAET
ncbi:hypothetical protein MPLSOD_30007 [Mesorhizobium sp. SOD10]|nr:hypothetical protein MPLSOD_30007 [Mesorhizobium sp. SOD10]